MNGKRNNTTLKFGLLAVIALLALSATGGALTGVSTVTAQGDGVQGTVWIADEYSSSITVLDASTNAVITTLSGVAEPHNLQVSPDGTTVWAVSGSDSLAVAIDTGTYTLLGTVPTGDHPAHIIVSPDGSTVYVTNSEDNTVSVIDVASMSTVTAIPVGESPHGLRPSPDGKWVYVANAGGTTLSVIDTTTNTEVAQVEVGQRPVQVAFSPSGDFVYVSLNTEDAVGKVDVATRTLVGKVSVDNGPIQVFVTPDDRYLLVANQGMDDSPSTTVSIVDTRTFAVVSTLEVGDGPHGVVVEPSGRYAYITNIYGNDAAVIDLQTLAVVKTVLTGNGPNGISFSPLPASPAPALEIALALPSEMTESAAGANDHTAHHPGAAATPEPTPEAAPTEAPDSTAEAGQGGSADMMAMMQQMSGMMDSMMGAEMSDEMRNMMEMMRGMMPAMGGTDMNSMDMTAMMQQMSGMMDDMMGMEMPDEMRSMMEMMRGMMPMMSMMDGDDSTRSSDSMEGMPMGDADGDAGAGHAMTPISREGVPDATVDLGGQPLEGRLVDGVKVFELTAQPVLWDILDDVNVVAWTYNGSVPGPQIRVNEGDQVRIVFKNELPEPTTIHWHGIDVPNAMDGVPGITQDPVQPGEGFTYEFTASPAGTYMYHSHFASDVQVSIGLYAPFIIDPVGSVDPAPDVDATLVLSEWRVVDGETYPAMPMAGAEPNYFTINGKAFPATQQIEVQQGQRVRLRLINIGQLAHPMHLHGRAFEIVAIDGHPVPDAARLAKDTVNIAPGERYDIEFTATEPGQWLFHCHILHHTTNDGADPGGLMLIVNVTAN